MISRFGGEAVPTASPAGLFESDRKKSNPSPFHRKGLVTHVSGPKFNRCSSTLTSYERLVCLLGAGRINSGLVAAGTGCIDGNT